MRAKKKRTLREDLALAKQINDDQATTIGDMQIQLRRTELAYDAEVAFWKREVAHLQDVAVNAVISAARKP
jgi:hypothetical protein